MVLGVRVHGDKVVNAEVTIDDQFRQVPVPNLLGVPILYNKLSGTGGDDSHIRSNVIVRFMANPDDGFAPDEWQYGGGRGPAPPIALARRDGLPFSVQDWNALQEFYEEWSEAVCDAEEDRVNVSQGILKPAKLTAFIRGTQGEDHPTAFLSLRFPLGSTVVAEGLSVQELNGKEGEVAQFSRDRVGIAYPGRDGPVAIKPERLTLVTEAVPLEEPDAKRQDTGNSKQDRQKNLEKQEAWAICNRFVECLREDTFPEKGDLHLFGVGCEYHSRAQEVLGVWQGAVKHRGLDTDKLVEAMLHGRTKELFEELCHDISTSGTPMQTYAELLIKNRFAALEWDTL